MKVVNFKPSDLSEGGLDSDKIKTLVLPLGLEATPFWLVYAAQVLYHWNMIDMLQAMVFN